MVESSYGVGRLKGREEGRQEGKQEAKLEVAISLFDILDDATIAKKTGLPLTERFEKWKNQERRRKNRSSICLKGKASRN